MVNKYVDELYKRINETAGRLEEFPGYNKYLKYNWKHISDGYGGFMSIHYPKGTFTFGNIFKRKKLVKLIYNIEHKSDLSHRVMNDDRYRQHVEDALKEAEDYLAIAKRESLGMYIALKEKLDGREQTVIDLLKEM